MCTTVMLSDKEFLKSAQGKLVNNKRKAEPDMRMEALLGSTCKRLRREIKSNKIDTNGQATHGPKKHDGEFVLDVLTANEYQSGTVLDDDDANWPDNYFVGLLDDPKQVEMFLRQVENQCQTDASKERSIETNENSASIYDISEKSAVSSDHSPRGGDGANDFDMFCSNFESLYEELLDSLASVEKWMSLAANDSVKVEYSNGYLSADQNEAMVDLSSLFDFAKDI